MPMNDRILLDRRPGESLHAPLSWVRAAPGRLVFKADDDVGDLPEPAVIAARRTSGGDGSGGIQQ